MFELVAESVEDVKTLVEKFAEQESYTVEKGKKLRVKAVPFYNSYYQSPSEFLVSLENCSSLIFFFFYVLIFSYKTTKLNGTKLG